MEVTSDIYLEFIFFMCKIKDTSFERVPLFLALRIERNYLSGQGSAVVECLTGDRGAAGSSLTGVPAFCP